MAPKKKKAAPRKHTLTLEARVAYLEQRVDLQRQRLDGLASRTNNGETNVELLSRADAEARVRLGKLESLQRETRMPEREPTLYNAFTPAIDKLALVRRQLKRMLDELG